MPIDLNNAPEQRGDLIPDGTICVVQMTLRPGGVGEGGWLKASKDRGAEMIDAELTVVEGPHAKRKFWEMMVVAGTTEGHQKAQEISFGKLRAIIESARGIRPDDQSEAARAGRVMEYTDLNDVRFVCKVGIEKGTGGYKDKNRIAEVITPDRQAWAKVEQIPASARVAAAPLQNTQRQAPAPAQGMTKPAWAS